MRFANYEREDSDLEVISLFSMESLMCSLVRAMGRNSEKKEVLFGRLEPVPFACAVKVYHWKVILSIDLYAWQRASCSPGLMVQWESNP
jgi:hypothetical protein